MTKMIVSILIFISAAIVQGQGNLPRGTVEIPDGATIVVVSDSGERITIRASEPAVQLPVGKYSLESWTMERKDQDGSIWKLTGSNVDKKGVFYIIENQEVKLPAGVPIFSSLTVSQENSTYRLSHCLTGQLSETIELTKNGSRLDAPKLNITNADGSYQETLNFQYG